MAKLKNKKAIFGVIVVLVLAAVVVLAWPSHQSPKTANNSVNTADHTANPPTTNGGFNKTLYSINDASSLWVVVNKGRALPSTYVPQGLRPPNVPLRLGDSSPEMWLRPDAATALEAMFAAAKQSGINLMLESGYRSYSEQVTVYNGYVKDSGVAQADTFSARPGHSEHQTGLAADIEPISRHCEVDQCFENTPEGQWLATNAYKYGFIIRYPKDGQNLTGYEYEPWHVRYLGKDLAAQIHSSGQTLEQFFSLPIYTSYPAASYEIKND